MGLQFDASTFPGFSDGRPVEIDLIHQARIEVTETGTKAAAASFGAVSFRTISEPEFTTIKFDRPFIGLIVNDKTVLFSFVVNEV